MRNGILDNALDRFFECESGKDDNCMLQVSLDANATGRA
jgi:hypothetical protein